MGVEGVLAVRGEGGEDVLGQLAGVLQLTAVHHLALDQADAPPLARRAEGLMGLVEGEDIAVHDQAEVAPAHQARHQQHHLPFRPAIGAAAEALLHQVFEDHLAAGLAHEVGVLGQLSDGLLVALAGLQGEAEIVAVAGAEHGPDLRLGVGGEVRQIAELVEAVAHQVIEGVGDGHGGRSALGLQRLADGKDGGLAAELFELQDQALAALAVLLLAFAQDAQGGVGGGAVVLAADILVGLDEGTDLPGEALVVVQAQQQLAALGGAVEQAAGLVVEAIVVRQGGDDREHQVAIGAAAVGVQVAQAGEAEVLVVAREAVLAQALEHVLEDQLGQQLGLLGRAEIHVLDLAADVALLVGEEEEVLAVAPDQGLALQAQQAGLDLAAQGEAVGVDAVDEEGDQVVDIAADLVDVADQEQGLEEPGVEGLQLVVALGVVDGGLDHAFEEALDGRVEAIHGHQHAHRLGAELHGGGLEGVEHGALAAGQVQAGDPMAADGLEDLLHQLELVGREGVDVGEVLGVGIGLEGHADVAEAELVLEDVGAGAVERGQLGPGGVGLGQQTLLDDLVDVAAGQGQPGLEAALNLGKVVGLAGAHLAEDGVDVLLGGDHHPGAPAAGGAEVLGDGLEAEHQVGVLADELADLVHQEDQAMGGAAAVEILAHPAGEVLHREQRGEVGLGLVQPAAGALGALAQGVGQRLHHLVEVEAVAVALGVPGDAGHGVEGGLEVGKLAKAVEAALHVGDVRMVAAVAALLVEDLEEDPQDDVAAAAAVGLAVDVEQDDLGVALDGALDVGGEHGVLDLAVEEVKGAPGLALVADLTVL